MSRDKQIEEMTKDLCDIECKGMKCKECDGYGCEYRMLAEALYNKGYRKASDVLYEINNSLIKPDFNSNEIAIGFDWAITDVRKLLLKLKKKYESEGADDEN